MPYIRDTDDNGQNNNMNIKQSTDNILNSNLDPSNDTINSCTQNDINTSNDEPSISLASSNKASGSGSRVAKSTGARAKSQVSGSSSPSVRSSPRVQSQKALGRHISDAVAVAALFSVSRQVSSSRAYGSPACYFQKVMFAPLLTIMALSLVSVNVNGMRDADKRLSFLQWLSLIHI